MKITARRCHKGIASIEMVLVMPILIIIFAGIVELGHLFIQYTTLNKALQNGARFAVVDVYGTDRLSDIASESDIKNIVVYGIKEPVAGVTESLLPNFTTDDVVIDNSDSNYVVIEAKYNYNPIFASLPFTDSSSSFEMNASSIMRVSP